MNYDTECSRLGYTLLKAGDGSNIEIHCAKCNENDDRNERRKNRYSKGGGRIRRHKHS